MLLVIGQINTLVISCQYFGEQLLINVCVCGSDFKLLSEPRFKKMGAQCEPLNLLRKVTGKYFEFFL